MGVLNEIYNNTRIYKPDSNASKDDDGSKVATQVVAKAEENAEASEKK